MQEMIQDTVADEAFLSKKMSVETLKEIQQEILGKVNSKFEKNPYYLHSAVFFDLSGFRCKKENQKYYI